MSNFIRSTLAYSVMLPPYPNDAGLPTNPPIASLVAIPKIEPLWRSLPDGIPEARLFATKKRLADILRGFRTNDQMPPIWISKNRSGHYSYKIQHGVHRFYASIAAGFSHIPAIVVEPFCDPNSSFPTLLKGSLRGTR